MTLHLNATGGLGNQLFQIAALIEASDRIGVERHIRFKSTGKTHRFFESKVLLDTLGISLCSLRCRLETLGRNYFQTEADFDIFDDLSDHSALSGYFQNSHYNLSSRQKLVAAIALSFKSCCDLAAAPRTNDVAVHVRLGDYLLDETNFKYHGVLSENYFREAIKALYFLGELGDLYVFSDNPDQARDKIESITSTIIPGTKVIVGVCKNNNLLCEIYRLGNFNNLILSNSSFSWWAGVMRNRKNTIGPLRWYREKSMRHVNPMIEGWSQIVNVFEGEVTI